MNKECYLHGLAHDNEIWNPYSHFHQSPQREEFSSICRGIRRTCPSILCFGPCELFKMAVCPYQGNEVFAQHHYGLVWKAVSLGSIKSSHKFSAIPFDQAHEQENKMVKVSGGMVGLTEKPKCFQTVDDLRTRNVKIAKLIWGGIFPWEWCRGS